jgi:hypothetical protein
MRVDHLLALAAPAVCAIASALHEAAARDAPGCNAETLDLHRREALHQSITASTYANTDSQHHAIFASSVTNPPADAPCASLTVTGTRPSASLGSPTLQGPVDDEDECEEWEEEDESTGQGDTDFDSSGGSTSTTGTNSSLGGETSGTGANCTYGKWQCSGTELQLCGYTTVDAVCEWSDPDLSLAPNCQPGST